MRAHAYVESRLRIMAEAFVAWRRHTGPASEPRWAPRRVEPQRGRKEGGELAHVRRRPMSSMFGGPSQDSRHLLRRPNVGCSGPKVIAAFAAGVVVTVLIARFPATRAPVPASPDSRPSSRASQAAKQREEGRRQHQDTPRPPSADTEATKAMTTHGLASSPAPRRAWQHCRARRSPRSQSDGRTTAAPAPAAPEPMKLPSKPTRSTARSRLGRTWIAMRRCQSRPSRRRARCA